jgi:hypothetical protein
MGLNSIHQKYEDFVQVKNLTKNTTFFCSIITDNFSKMQVVQGITDAVIQCVIVINGFSGELNINDYLKLPLYDEPLKVENIRTERTSILYKKRNDLNNFTARTEVALS